MLYDVKQQSYFILKSVKNHVNKQNQVKFDFFKNNTLCCITFRDWSYHNNLLVTNS